MVFAAAKLQPVLPDPRYQFIQFEAQRAARPCLGGDCSRRREVALEHRLHLLRKLRAEDHRVDFIVVQEAAPVEIGRAYA